MASERKVSEIIRNAGYEPIEDRAIIVKYAPSNMSERIINFFSMEFYVLQLCKDAVVLVPFSKMTLALKKEVALEIPFSRIHRTNISEDGLNWKMDLETEDGLISLSAQQKELSEFRTSGTLATGIGGLDTGAAGAKFLRPENWHRKNMDAVLDALRNL